ncbi:MAG: four helix bundle protein [Bacteroidetes bacterium]|nr:MAG: four helix bundle protein [Bacteroidota bacterium]
MQDKKYDLEARTERFSLRVRNFCLKLKKDTINLEYIKQLVKAAGSVPANYIEANESLGDQDKKMHIKISRKEAKESGLWLKHVLAYGNDEIEKERLELLQEAHELENIFGSIYRKLELPTNI